MALLETPAKNDRARPDFDESTPILAEITAALTVEDHTVSFAIFKIFYFLNIFPLLGVRNKM